MSGAGDQREMPYLRSLLEHAELDPGRYNVPAHRGGPRAPRALVDALGERALALDIPPLVWGIDDGPRPTPFEQAQLLAAEAWGAQRTWFLLNGASQANHVASLALAQRGRHVLMQRNVHSSAIDGLTLSGLEPRFVLPEVDEAMGIAHCLLPETLDAALREDADVSGVIVVSPTYYGMAADVEGLVAVAHRHGVPIVVDQAWGAHFAFHDELPLDALAAGADLVISSTHKLLGSLTQSAMLHLGPDSMLDQETVDRAVTMLDSTSPNALLGASLDAARQRAAVDGRELIGATLRALERIRADVQALPGVDVLDERLVGRMGIAAIDPFRMAIDVSGTGRSGIELQPLLRTTRGVFVELASAHALVAIFSIGDEEGDGERLVAALRDALEASEGAPATRALLAPRYGPLAISPRATFLARHEHVPLEQASGRICAESLAVYPPGIPNVLAGEELTPAIVAFLAASVASGSMVRGASDRSLRTLRVVVTDDDTRAE
ncbi:aminotransferase class I/II-fold pyridoxal phosphate-dependent enzyme [Conexibacter woesei]|uniref:Orn/Lys/Arg decarboxylase major region n=1 Tax=Conexibacter woesei (strain DSM 14684 / CCUG 47730 / CIP 108061 / JCM 11494 / NBRC 100937 / ID131577) TaxID=469383 RepID=D3FAR1_CONWI|nr:aminotransferase class I/II-fold pyridoxal phosphate-dependent enzyme [Conexibacter woesei]ADB51224.1 Orn/Lys/Arg decarboxylase major region [Conexibacter woesei DSM 14684]